jgi:NAD-dependent dihydropyrimidine dehydrogenase PreA subunit
VVAEKSPRPFTRVIPVGVSITPRQQILAFDNVADIIERADTVAVTKCTCRLSMRHCDRPLENCLQVGRAAQYTIARGSGRQISKQEALDILRQAEEAGLIHVTVNKQDVSNFICNCCPCCCQTMPVLLKYGTYVIDPSRFTAQVDSEACTGCGVCHDRCYFGAVSWSEGEGSPSLVDAKKCMGCGLCLVTCPTGAITLAESRPQDFVPS